jgi:acyl carrier protein
MERVKVVSDFQGGSPQTDRSRERPGERLDADADAGTATLEFELEIKQLIVETLRLGRATAEAIEAETPLFDGDIGLDSIDALQMAVAIERRFGVRIQPDDERNREILRSVRSLSQYILGGGGHEL